MTVAATVQAPATASTQPSRWVSGVVWMWTALMLAPNLQVWLYPRLHWIVSAAMVLLIAPFLLRATFVTFAPGFVPAWLLAVSVLLSSLNSPNPLYGLGETVKLVIILVAALTLFVSHTEYARVALRAFEFSTYLNTALLAGGLVGIAPLAHQMFPGRWGTALNYPGSLWRIGVLTVWLSAYLVLTREKPLRYLALLAASLVLMYFDGSRTGALLMLFVAAPFLAAVRVIEGYRSLATRLAGVVTATLVVMALGLGWNWVASQGLESGMRPPGRIAELAWRLKLNGVAGLAAIDPIRARMLHAGVTALHEASIVGHGIETTQVETEVGAMSLHMTYLQVLSDLGWLGLVAYVWLVLGWLPWLPRAWANIHRLPGPAERVPYYNAIFLLLFFALAGVFHPLSTEWSEWVTFVVPYALFWEAAQLHRTRPGPTPIAPRSDG
jgi:hypothetical protein